MSGVACPTCGRTWGDEATFCGACGDQLPGSSLSPSSPTPRPARRPRRAGAVVGMVVSGVVLAGVGALVAGTAGPGEPSVADDEVAVPSGGNGGARATDEGGAPPVVECRRAAGPFDCARWMRRPAGDAGDDGSFGWATATTDRVLVAHGSMLTALDRATGRTQWEHSVGVDLVDLRVDGEVVVAQTGHGTTFGLSIHDGTMRWTAEDTERLLLERPTPGTSHTVRRDGDELVLTARNTADGTTRWRHRLTAPDQERFPGLVRVLPSEPVTLVTEEGTSELPTVVALDSEDGTERWRRAASQPVYAARDTTVVIDVDPDPAGPDDTSGPVLGPPTAMVGLDSADGTERWRQEVGSVFGGRLFRDDMVLVWSPPDGITAFDLATGVERWRAGGLGFERPVRAFPREGALAGGSPVIVSFSDEDDLVIGRDPETGQLVWRTQPVERAEFLTVVDGRIVAGQGGGSVTQLDPATGQVLVTVSTAPTGRPWFVADDVLVDAESGWVAAVDLPQPPSG